MSTVYELAESLYAAFRNVFERLEKIFRGLEEVYEKIVEIIEAFENEDQSPNRRLPITAVIGSLNRNIIIPPFGPHRTGRCMGGWMGITNNLLIWFWHFAGVYSGQYQYRNVFPSQIGKHPSRPGNRPGP
jgi:hypothetical protein